MKSIPQKQVVNINSGLSIGVTFKLPPTLPDDKLEGVVHYAPEHIAYVEKVVELGKEFEKLGWDVKNQEHANIQYLVCAQYSMNELDYKLLEKARKIVDELGPAEFVREWYNY